MPRLPSRVADGPASAEIALEPCAGPLDCRSHAYVDVPAGLCRGACCPWCAAPGVVWQTGAEPRLTGLSAAFSGRSSAASVRPLFGL